MRTRHSVCKDFQRRGLGEQGRYHEGVRRAVIRLYQAIDRLCLTAGPGATTKRQYHDYVAYSYRGRDFCWVCLRPRVVSIALRLTSDSRRPGSVPGLGADRPGLWRDVVVVSVNKTSQLEVTALLIQRAFASLAERPTGSRSSATLERRGRRAHGS